MIDDQSDEALVVAARAGSAAAFNTLVDRHQQAVRAFLRRLVRDASDADDLAQDTFVSAWMAIQLFRGESQFRSWVCSIAWRKARGASRSTLRRVARERRYEDRAELERPHSIAAEDQLALHAALEALPLEQRAAVALCLGGDFSHAEAAATLGLPLGTVKSHVARGREKLLKALQGEPLRGERLGGEP